MQMKIHIKALPRSKIYASQKKETKKRFHTRVKSDSNDLHERTKTDSCQVWLETFEHKKTKNTRQHPSFWLPVHDSQPLERARKKLDKQTCFGVNCLKQADADSALTKVLTRVCGRLKIKMKKKRTKNGHRWSQPNTNEEVNTAQKHMAVGGWT